MPSGFRHYHVMPPPPFPHGEEPVHGGIAPDAAPEQLPTPRNLP